MSSPKSIGTNQPRGLGIGGAVLGCARTASRLVVMIVADGLLGGGVH
jgi:hypothetical protein